MSVDYSHASFSADLSVISGIFSERLPRYTSYPTAAEFTPDFDYTEVASAMQNTLAVSPSLSVYVHLAYCPQLCHFCACNKIVSRDVRDREQYVADVLAELAQLRSQFTLPWNIQQVHLGGGSPSYLSVSELEHLDAALSAAGAKVNTARSIEMDCRTTTPEKIELLYRQGYRRFSLGIQDFDAQVQKLVNRRQAWELVRDTCDEIRLRSGCSLNFDLIYGLPGQSVDSFDKTIQKVIALGPDRIALYGYANVSHKIKVQRSLEKYPLPSANERLAIFQHSLRELEFAGYRYIGLDHFAKPGDELSRTLDQGKLRRNFMGYTTDEGSALLGLGISAISDIGDYLIQNHLTPEPYRDSLRKGRIPVQRIIRRSLEDKVRAVCIESLMCQREVRREEIEARFPGNDLPGAIFKDSLLKLPEKIPEELVHRDASRITITERGAPFLRQVASIFDANLGKTGGAIFSSGI